MSFAELVRGGFLVLCAVASASVLADDGRFNWKLRQPAAATPISSIQVIDWEARARDAIAHEVAVAGTTGKATTNLVLRDLHDRGTGPVVVTFREYHQGFEVFGSEADVLLARSGQLIAISGDITRVQASVLSTTMGVTPSRALEISLEEFGFTVDRYSLIERQENRSTYKFVQAGDEDRTLIDAEVKRMWIAQGGELRSMWRTTFVIDPEIGGPQGWTVLIDATSGKRLRTFDLKRNETFNYRVFADPISPHRPLDSPLGNGMNPHPTGNPDDVVDLPVANAPLVSLGNAGISTGDDWLDGIAVDTHGNHASVYLDLAGSDGLDHAMDRRAPLSAPGSFDHAFDSDAGPRDPSNRDAAMTHMFYVINSLHDVFYNHGFDEAAGNAQADNFGRGGVAGDRLLGEAQDVSGMNNANMLTPPDGTSPRMQMFIWNPRIVPTASYLEPAGEAVTGPVTPASFGPQVFDLAGEIAEADDGTGVAADACEPLVDITGKIALIRRGTCTYVIKVRNAANAGAVGVIVANSRDGDADYFAEVLQPPEGDDALDIVIPVLGVTENTGIAIRAHLADGPVRMRLQREQAMLDSALDTTIVAHEWGHYLSNRLIGDGTGLVNSQGWSMGEGWSDFVALLMTVEASDRLVTGNDNFQGSYSISPYLTDPYFGIRRAPYSTDFTKNPLTFRHIRQGEALPEFEKNDLGLGDDLPLYNSFPHNTGEIWALALWEVYTALLNDGRYDFEQARARMLDYLVASLKLTPSEPTIIEARDAMLAVGLATDEADYRLMWQAFAARGMGIGARAPSRYSQTHDGVVESFLDDAPILEIVEMTFREGASDGSGICDADGVIDEAELGHVYLRLANNGTRGLTGATLAVDSSSSLVWPEGNDVPLPSIAPYSEVELRLPISLSVGRATAEVIEVRYSFSHDGSDDVVLPEDGSIVTNVHYDSGNGSHDDMEVPALSRQNWNIEASTVDRFDWQLSDARDKAVEYGSAADFGSGTLWHGVAPGATVTHPVREWLRIETNPIEVSSTGNLRFSFDHAFRFETLLDPDGGLPAYPDVGMVTVTDVHGAFLPPTIDEIPGAQIDGPAPGQPWMWVDTQQAYGGELNNGFLETTTVTLPDSYRGKTVRLAFEVHFDWVVGDFGWVVDNLVVENAAEPPFLVPVADAASCDGFSPQLSAGEDLELAERNAPVAEQAVVQLQGRFQYASAAAEVEWTQLEGPAVALVDADTLSASFTVPRLAADTEFSFRLAGSDGDAELIDDVTVTVTNVNGIPQLQMPEDLRLREDEGPVILVAHAMDEEGQNLRYQWEQVDGPALTFSGDSHQLQLSLPDIETSQTFVLDLTVSDGEATVTDSVKVTVDPVSVSEPEPEPEPEPSSGGGGGSLFWCLPALSLIWRRGRFASA
jgi:hypothetical protein